MCEDVRLVRAQDADQIKTIADIESKCFGHPYTFKQLIEEVENPKNIVLSAYVGRECVGYMYYSAVLDECELLRIAVIPQYRHLGIGTKILQLSYKYLGKDIKSIFLEVSKNNIYARKMYTKFGFKEISVRQKYYHDGSDAVIMRKNI